MIDGRTAGLLLNTLLLVAYTAAIALPVGCTLALILFRTALSFRRALIAFLAVQILIPLVLQAGAWQAGFGLAGWWTLQNPGTVWLDGWRGAVWIHALAAIPAVTLIIGIGLLRVDAELEERGLLAAPPWRVLMRVTAPRVTAWLALAILWIAITVAGEMSVTDFFQVRTFAEELYTDATIGSLDDATVGVWPMIVMGLALSTLATLVVLRWMPTRRELDTRATIVIPLVRLHIPALVFVVVVLAVTLALPVGNLLWKAGVLVTNTDAGRLRSWSLVKCLTIIVSSPWRYRQEYVWSTGIGVASATAATFIAWPLAWRLRMHRKPGVISWLAMGMLAAVPGPVVGLLLIRLLNQPDIPALTWLYDRTPLAPWLAQTMRTLPWTWLIAWSACRTIPDEVIDRLQLLGARTLGSLRWVVLNSQTASVAAGWCVAMIISLGDVAGSILVLPPGIMTLPIRIFGLLHYGVEDEVAGICLAMIIVVLGLIGIVRWAFVRRPVTDLR